MCATGARFASMQACPHVPCLQVREAMASLLVAVCNTRALHFYEVSSPSIFLSERVPAILPMGWQGMSDL